MRHTHYITCKKISLVLFSLAGFVLCNPASSFGQLCTGSLGDPVVDITFGSGTATHSGALASGTTSYTYSSADFPTDGSYTVENTTAGSGSVWWPTTDHTGNTGGYMMVVNASVSKTDYFYKSTVTGLCPGTTYEFAAWVVNLLRSRDISPPNITFTISTTTGTVLGTYTTGSIPLTTSGATWKQYGLYFTTPTAWKTRDRGSLPLTGASCLKNSSVYRGRMAVISAGWAWACISAGCRPNSWAGISPTVRMPKGAVRLPSSYLMTKISLLLVEDDVDLGHLLSSYLKVQGLEVALAGDAEAALLLLAGQRFDIVVLDVMLPKGDGFAVADTIKRRYPGLPFLFLTARRQKEDILRGLGLGADDYMVKPFDADELILRVHNILRRTNRAAAPAVVFAIGKYRFEPSQLRLSSGSASILLTKKEAGVLELLARRPGRIVDRKDVLEQVWGNADYFNGRSMDVYIGRLRKLLEQDSQISLESIRGLGFILHLPEDGRSGEPAIN